MTAQIFSEPRRRFVVHVLCDDEQGLAALGCRLQDGKHVLEVGDLLVVEQDVGGLHVALHLLGVGDEVGGDVSAVELHALDDVDAGLGALGLLDGDDALFLYLAHGLGDETAYLLVVVGADAGHVLDLLHVVVNLLGHSLEGVDDLADGFVDAALQVHGVCAGGDVLEAGVYDGLGQHGGGGGAVACLVAGLGGYLLDELCAHVLEGVFELHFAGYGHAVLGDVGCAEFLFDDDVAAFGAERYLDGVGQGVNAFLELFASLYVEFYLFCHCLVCYKN